MITNLGPSIEFARWCKNSLYRHFFWRVWNNAVDATANSDNANETCFTFYRAAICLIMDFYDHDLANLFQQAMSEEDLWEHDQLKFIHVTIFSPAEFLAAIAIEPEWPS